jgi:glycosyltransferase involved in cell wall biosynthesis
MELRKHLGIAPEAAVISAVARLRAEKGIDVLIDALPTVERLIRCPVWLLIVGEGHEAPRLRAKAALTAADRIRFLGGAADVTPWFQIADVVAVPSLFEPFGLSALEAIASRRPIVASRVGGLPEFIEHGKTGTLVPPGDPVALADGLASTLASADLAQRMAQAAYRVYRERFTSDIMVDAWLEHYRELLGPKQMSRAHS